MRPRNTAKQDPLINLFVPIEAQERQGQGQLVSGESLPSECSDRAALEAAGVVFGAPYSDDKLFCPVTLPKGWKKQATEHAMHSNLVDDKGRIRASIFYKAASYDRRADMYAVRRYSVNGFIRCDAAGIPTAEDYSSRPTNFLVAVMDGKQVIHSIGAVDVKNGYHTRKQFEEDGTKWLDEHFPEWKSVAAYWD